MNNLTLNNGVQMPMVGFGTWDVRGEKGKRCIQDALELGYRLIDTAQMYDNEEMVGKSCSGERSATAGYFSHHETVPVQRQLPEGKSRY